MNKLTEREMLILIMSEQKQFKQALEEIKHVLLLKADASKLADLEKDVKELQKENSEIKRTQWLSIGGAGSAGDPWTTDLSAYNTPGTAGKVVKQIKSMTAAQL